MTGITWTQFEQDHTVAYYFVNYTNEVQEITVEVESSLPPEIWDTLTGEIMEVQSEKVQGTEHIYRVKMSLNQNYGIFLMTGKNKEI